MKAEEKRIVEKAYDGTENLTHEEYTTIGHLADKFSLEHDLPLKEAAKRILQFEESK